MLGVIFFFFKITTIKIFLFTIIADIILTFSFNFIILTIINKISNFINQFCHNYVNTITICQICYKFMYIIFINLQIMNIRSQNKC